MAPQPLTAADFEELERFAANCPPLMISVKQTEQINQMRKDLIPKVKQISREPECYCHWSPEDFSPDTIIGRGFEFQKVCAKNVATVSGPMSSMSIFSHLFDISLAVGAFPEKRGLRPASALVYCSRGTRSLPGSWRVLGRDVRVCCQA